MTSVAVGKNTNGESIASITKSVMKNADSGSGKGGMSV